ncbi:MAG: hypothetical protein WBM24_09600 [Candidatus Sulfotelmatobacter sp.]
MSVSFSYSPSLPAESDPGAALPVYDSELARPPAPIALFVYNRLAHTRRTVEALRANPLAGQSDLFIFADAAKDESGGAAVAAVRKFIRAIDGFRSVTISERERNLGLSNSIIRGVTQLCRYRGRAIILEDDLLTTPDFLTFVNRGLDRYENSAQVFSVTGFNFPIAVPPNYPYDAFASVRSCSWGWATWKDRWEKAKWSVSVFDDLISTPEGRRRVDQAGPDLAQMLGLQAAGKIQGWDVIWGFEHLRHRAVAIRPAISKVYNIGFDGSGIHCRRAPFEQSALRSEGLSAQRFPEVITPDPYFGDKIMRLHRLSYAKKIWRTCSRYFSSRAGR